MVISPNEFNALKQIRELSVQVTEAVDNFRPFSQTTKELAYFVNRIGSELREQAEILFEINNVRETDRAIRKQQEEEEGLIILGPAEDEKDELPDEFYRDLDNEEEKEFRQWARDNFNPAVDSINPAWHPVIRVECRCMIEEYKGDQYDDFAHGRRFDGSE